MDFSAFRESLSEVGEPPKKVCAVCQAPAEKSCGACHGVYYCSIEHQKSHWKEHKKDCPPIRIVTSPELGPHFVATRDLPPWTLLLTELPILVNPSISSKDYPGIVTCISCRSIIPNNPWTCSQCSTPFFCDQSCSMNKVHSEFECGILSKCNEQQRAKLCIPPNLMYLRAVHLKNNDPETWTKLLEVRGAHQCKPRDLDENAKWFIREILPIIGKGLGFEADLSKLMEIYLKRGIMVDQDGIDPIEDQGESHVFYLNASNFAQNCFPNCTPIIGKGPQFQLQVRTTVEIKKGHIPSIDFQGVSQWMGAMVRQNEMHKIGSPLCICPRCTDPTGTELGTMLSAVKCTQPDCKDGYLLPVDVRNMAENAPWRCNGSDCRGMYTWAKIERITSTMKRDIEDFKKSSPVADAERNSEYLEFLKMKLHPNHHLVLGLERNICDALDSRILANERMKPSLPRMDLHISMLEHLLRMVDILDPGLSPNRAYLLFRLFTGLNQRLEWYSEFDQKDVQKGLMKRTLEIIDIFLPIAELYPEIWIPPFTQILRERQSMLQMALNSIN